MKKCQICEKQLSPKAKYLCGECGSKKHELTCVACGEKRLVTAHYYRKVDVPNNMCKTCRNKSQTGEKNPNYGKKWSKEKRKAQSELIKSKVDDEYRKNCAKGMKGKKWSDESKRKRMKTMEEKYGKDWARKQALRTYNGESGERIKKIIGEKSKEKWTEAFRKRFMENMYDLGHYVRPEVKDDYLFYREISNWNHDVFHKGVVGYQLFEEKGLYDGVDADRVVRDHMYGRRAGFDNGVFPELISHPANCQFIPHRKNISKSKVNNDCSITLEELFERIKKWKFDFENQEECIKLIKQYQNGKRYNKKNYY